MKQSWRKFSAFVGIFFILLTVAFPRKKKPQSSDSEALPFVSDEFVVKRRGVELTNSERARFIKDYKHIVELFI